MKFKILIIFILFILLNIALDQYYKNKFKKENFPPKIIYSLKEDIELPLVEEGEEIPKNIYRCYKDLEGISKFVKVFNLTEERMPDYKQIYYTDKLIDTYIKNNFSERIYKAYNSINPEYGAAKADLFRYLIIYKEGGIYMDIKTGPIKKIDNFFNREDLKGKLLASIGKNGWYRYFPNHHLKDLFGLNDDWSFVTNLWPGSEWQQFIIASNKGNPILGKVIKQVVSNIEEGKETYNKGKYSVIAMTGPIAYSLVIEKYKEEYKDKIKFFNSDIDYYFNHSLVDYKNIMGDQHYSKNKNKNILI
jgi:inositol phosphorylceramide mannosyltransferase catalytic subunit